MTDYGRLTAKDRREIRRAANVLRESLTRLGPGPFLPPWAVSAATEFDDDDDFPFVRCAVATQILESLLMTDRRFR